MLKKKGILQLNAPQHGSIPEFSFKLNVRVSYLSGFCNLKNISAHFCSWFQCKEVLLQKL